MTDVAVPLASAPFLTFAPIVSGYNPLTIQIPTGVAPFTTFAPAVTNELTADVANVAIPPANVPISVVEMGGRRFSVYVAPAWYKFLNNLYERTGGTVDAVATATNSVTEAIVLASTAASQVQDVQTGLSSLSATVAEQGEQIVIVSQRVDEIEP